jgi:hypothetical protein
MNEETEKNAQDYIHTSKVPQLENGGQEKNGASRYALFAFGHYYPNGGIDDLRGVYPSVEECRQAFKLLGSKLMIEQGYSSNAHPTGHDCTGQIVELKTLQCIETIQA